MLFCVIINVLRFTTVHNMFPNLDESDAKICEEIAMKPDIEPLNKTDTAIFRFLLLNSVIFILFGLFVCGSPRGALDGLWEIYTTREILITDYIKVGGLDGAFLNSGLAMLLAILLIKLSGAEFNGKSIGCCFIVAGFALFGKNIPNMSSIIFGTYLYSCYKNEKFKDHIYTALFATCLAPIITHIALTANADTLLARIILAGLVGVFIGFVMTPVARLTAQLHIGMLIFNVGFAAGIVATVIVAVLRSLGWEFHSVLVWSTGNDLLLGSLISALFLLMIAVGFVLNGCSFKGLGALTCHSGQSPCDYVILEGFPLTLMNMGILGFMSMGYVLAVGGPLNGPTIGGILTVVGFGAFGMNYYNIIWGVLGIVLVSCVSTWQLNEPSILLAVLFCPCISPIAGKHGPFWGIVSGMFHVCVVRETASNFGWLNLYNNGFAAGFVCIFLLPVIETIEGRRNVRIEDEENGPHARSTDHSDRIRPFFGKKVDKDDKQEYNSFEI